MNQKKFIFLIGVTVGYPSVGIAVDFNYDEAINEWSAKTGVVVTMGGKRWVLENIAETFASDAEKAGFEPATIKDFRTALKTGGSVGVTNDRVTMQTAVGAFISMPLSDSARAAMIKRALAVNYINYPLELAPTVRVIVDPVPPPDYLVFINGEKVRVSPKGEYKPDPGQSRYA